MVSNSNALCHQVIGNFRGFAMNLEIGGGLSRRAPVWTLYPGCCNDRAFREIVVSLNFFDMLFIARIKFAGAGNKPKNERIGAWPNARRGADLREEFTFSTTVSEEFEDFGGVKLDKNGTAVENPYGLNCSSGDVGNTTLT